MADYNDFAKRIVETPVETSDLRAAQREVAAEGPDCWSNTEIRMRAVARSLLRKRPISIDPWYALALHERLLALADLIPAQQMDDRALAIAAEASLWPDLNCRRFRFNEVEFWRLLRGGAAA